MRKKHYTPPPTLFSNDKVLKSIIRLSVFLARASKSATFQSCGRYPIPPIRIADTYTKAWHSHKHPKFYSYKAVMANQNPILLSNDFKTFNSLNRNTNTVLFSGNSDIVLALVSYTTPKLTSLIYKYAYLIDNNKRHIKKGYYFYKYCEPLDPKGYYPLIRGLKLHLKREHDIN